MIGCPELESALSVTGWLIRIELTGELNVTVCFAFAVIVVSAEAGLKAPPPGCVARTRR